MTGQDHIEVTLRRWARAFVWLRPDSADWVPAELVPPHPLTEADMRDAAATHRAVEMLARPLREALVRTYVLQMPQWRQAQQQGLHVEAIDRWLQQARSAVDMARRGLVTYRPQADAWDKPL